jgi:hypothetical protein
MSDHPYLKAYMGGIFVPTLFLLMIMSVFTACRYVWNIPLPIERVIVFPMAVVPNVRGLWNVLYVRTRGRLPLGLHGALLPFLLAPAGYAVTRLLNFDLPGNAPSAVLVAFPVALLVYYLAWKHLVGFLNEVLGV